MEGLGRPSDPPVAKLLGPAAYVPCCTAAKLPLVRLSCRAANLPSSRWMFPLRLQKTLLFPWESADGRDIIEEAFRVSHVRTHFRTRPALGAPDPDGWRGREHVSWLFMNDDDEAQQRIINNLMLPYATGDFHPDYLHEHAGGRVSAFLKPDGVRVRPIGCASVWRRGTATLICKYVRKDASAYLTGSCPNFIQTAGSRDGATICAKLVSLIHDLPQDPEDPVSSARLILRMPFKCLHVSSVLVTAFLARHHVHTTMVQCRWGMICLILRLSSPFSNISAPWVMWPAAIATRITMALHIILKVLVVEYRGILWRW